MRHLWRFRGGVMVVRTLVGGGRVRTLLILPALLMGCAHHRLVRFELDRTLACPGQDVVVTWEVDGRATLAVVNGPSEPTAAQIQAAEKPVSSKATQTFRVTETTWFVIRAVDANQAKDPWHGTKHVDVPTDADEQKAATTTCSGTTCSGTFTVHAAHDAAKVTRISSPTLKQSGASHPATICVTHGALNTTCIAADHDLATDVPAAGEWTLSTTLPAGVPTSPPPGISVLVHITCP
jgi:hypothetical protein